MSSGDAGRCLHGFAAAMALRLSPKSLVVGQHDAHTQAAVPSVAQLYVAAMVAHDGSRDGETKAYAPLLPLLQSAKWLEDLIMEFFGDAGSLIVDDDLIACGNF